MASTGMRRVVEKAGRDPESIDVGYLWFLPPNDTAQTGPDGERQLFTGSVADWQEDAAALAEAGARHVILYLQRPTINETLDRDATCQRRRWYVFHDARRRPDRTGSRARRCRS